MAELPEGFVLDAPVNGPPEGFVVDPESSWTDHIPKALTGAPEEAERTTRETAASARQDLTDSFTRRQAPPEEGFWEGYGRDLAEVPGKAGKFVRGIGAAAAIPLAPFYGAGKSLIGRPMASAIHTAGKAINPEVAAKQTSEGIYEDIREDVGSALGTTKRMPASIPKAPLKGPVDVYTNNPSGGVPTKTTLPEPSLPNIKNASQAGYKHPDVTAVEFRPAAVRSLANIIEGDLIKNSFRPTTASASETFREIGLLRPRLNSNRGIMIADLDSSRRALGRLAKGKDGQGQPTTEATAATRAIDHIDDFLPNIKQADLFAGNAAKANSILQNARKDWASYKRGSLVDTLEENAGKQAGSSYFGGNLNNAIRQAFRPYGKNRHAKLPGWTDESKAAVDRVVSGGSRLSPANIARNVGRLAPDTKMGIVAHVAGAAYSGGYTAPIAVAGYAAKKLGIALTKRNVSKLKDMLVRESALQKARQGAMQPRSQKAANLLGPQGLAQIPERQREVPEMQANPYAP